MSNGKDFKALDDFWDISQLVPKKKEYPTHQKSTETVAIDLTPRHTAGEENTSAECRLTVTGSSSERDSVIHREISPAPPTVTKDVFDFCEEYSFTESPIHRVALKKWKCDYHFYDEFLKDALRYRDVKGSKAPRVAYFSYVPQYNQLSDAQLACYLSFREDCRRGVFGEIDYSYLLLYIFELINLGKHADVRETQRMLTELWKHYHKAFPALEGKLSRWICDFSLIHRLPPPENADSSLIRHESVLREYFITLPDHNIPACVCSLLKYCCSYDYHTSKFAKGDHLALYDEHVAGALGYVIRHFRGENGFLGDFTGGDSHMIRNAYEGALCCADQKYRIEIDYSSFSRTNELRFLIGDLVKYAENKIRAHIGVKSKLSVYSVTGELREQIDRYFAESLPFVHNRKKKEEPQAYDVLYELPRKPFSLAEAKQIETDSWKTTDVLVAAFEESEEAEVPKEVDISAETSDVVSPLQASEQSEDSLAGQLGELYAFVLALRDGDAAALAREEAKLGSMRDQIVDRINEIAVDYMGDILIEDGDDGYAVVEDYTNML